MARYRIGLMVGNKSIDYAHAIRMGVQNTLEDAGHILIAISDLIPFHSRSNAAEYFRVAFEVASRLDLDTIIVPAGIISGYLTSNQDELYRFLDILDTNKVLVVERNIPGYRCVYKDNAPGMHACMRHLIESCRFKKIAFIAGPLASKGSQERENIYYSEMESHGLEVKPSLLARGDFSGECGDAIDVLLDNNPDLEAIACCCDLIAHSVYRVMRRRGLRVGYDIAVTGFDDHEMSAHMDPPLSTVHMTGYDLGCMAAREAIRMCEKQPQSEEVLSSSFIARGSCGEDNYGMTELFKTILLDSPHPQQDIVTTMVDATLLMSSRHVRREFTCSMTKFVDKVRNAYNRHMETKGLDDQLFSTQDLGRLFYQYYTHRLSLEGFQSSALALLQALVEVSAKTDVNWIIKQISNLHSGIARMLNVAMQENMLDTSRKEWTSFHMIDDALRKSADAHAAYELILKDFMELGVLEANLYLLREPVVFVGTRTFAMSDALVPIGYLRNGAIDVPKKERTITLQELLDQLTPQGNETPVYTVGGIMAGNELVGVAAIDSGALDMDGQLVAFLNLGIALKHIQMIAGEREYNELLRKNNLLLERQSHYDYMTGVLNRRGFMDKFEHMLAAHMGEFGALYYLDLDGLKGINDTYGHDSGDEAIRQTTRVLKRCLPPNTLLGRLGGDEFVVFAFVPDEAAMDDICKAIDTGMSTFNAMRSHPFELSISYGGVFTAIDHTTMQNLAQMMSLADERLYNMKKARKTAATQPRS